MQNENATQDAIHMGEFDRPKLSTGLNVLTILSFIGCGIQLLTACWGFISAKTSFENKDKVMEQMNSGNMPSWAKSIMPNMAYFEEMVTKSYENRLPILILSLVAVGLCFYGLMEMRKFKKQGYLFYVIGELLPFVTMGLFIGTFMFAGMTFFIGAFIAALFIVLYAMQRKNLVY